MQQTLCKERRVRVEKPDELCFIISFAYFSQQTVEINSISFFYFPRPSFSHKRENIANSIICFFLHFHTNNFYRGIFFRLNSDKRREGGMRLRGRERIKNREMLRVSIDLLSVLSI